MRVKVRCEMRFTVATVAAAFVILTQLGNSPVSAQGQTRQFNVGDRVEIDTFLRGDYPGADKLAKWRIGTVIRLDNPEDRFGAYIVKVDEDGSEMRIRMVDKRWIRVPMNANAKPADPGNGKPGAPGNGKPGAPGNGKAADPAPDKPAGNQGKEFKVGDRVEIDVLMISVSSPADKQKWKAGTVTEVDRRQGYRPMYVVRLDPVPGQLPQYYRIPITPNIAERSWIRPGTGQAPVIHYDKLHVDANDTVLPDRPALGCDTVQQPTAKNGSPLPVELAKRLIRCALGEHPAQTGGQGATTVDITQFSVGAPRKWDLNRDTGAGGTVDTLVYPVRVKYTKKSFYRDQNTVVADREQLFACHVELGVWVCGPDQVLKEGTKTQIPVKK